MGQFEFKCPQCGQTVEADDLLRGQVAECPSCGKGIVIPRNMVDKPAVRLRSVSRNVNTPCPTQTSQPSNHLTEYERMSKQAAERRRKEKQMKLVKLIIVFVVLVVGFVWWRKSRIEEQEKALAQQEAKLENERREAEQNERIEKEEKDKKVSVANALHAYLDREEARLKDIIEETKIVRESIEVDQKELSEVLDLVSKEDARLAALSKKRGTKRYDKAEYVSLILKSHEIGRLFDKYCGEDLTAIYAKYKNDINAILKLHRESTMRLRKNKEKYYTTVKGIDEEVDKRNRRAQSQISSAANEAELSLRDQLKKRADLASEKRSVEKGLKGPRERSRIAELEKEIAQLDKVIATTRALVSANKAQAMHMEATTMESSARKKYDTAQEIRQSDDNDVHTDMQHESDIFNVAGRYEQMTLDKLRTAMRVSSEFQFAKAADARKKLDFIRRSTGNLELMKSDEIESVRKKIVDKLSEEVTGDGDEKKQTDGK